MATLNRHLRAMDLHNNGLVTEVVVIKEDPNNGDIFLIEVSELGEVDRRRLLDIIQSRDAQGMELWEAMSYKTLGNGENALKFFHQLVKRKTRSGAILSASSAFRGYDTRYAKPPTAQPNPPQQPMRPPSGDLPKADDVAPAKSESTKKRGPNADPKA